ncbi:hypothetical protein [Globicatella sanguinis]
MFKLYDPTLSKQVEELTNVVSELKDRDWIDYSNLIIPTIMAILSALFGYWLSQKQYNKTEKENKQKEKVKAYKVNYGNICTAVDELESVRIATDGAIKFNNPLSENSIRVLESILKETRRRMHDVTVIFFTNNLDEEYELSNIIVEKVVEIYQNLEFDNIEMKQSETLRIVNETMELLNIVKDKVEYEIKQQ